MPVLMPVNPARRAVVLATAVAALAVPLPAVAASEAPVAASQGSAPARATGPPDGALPAVRPATTADTGGPAGPAEAAEAAEAADAGLTLPRPSGRHATGRDTLHLVDGSRADPWVPRAGARELMVSVYYPARHGTGSDTVPYMTSPEAEALLEGQRLEGAVPVEAVTSVRTNSRADARPAGGRHPLVVLSPGFTLQRGTLSVLAEELASRGFVVAAVDHAHESYGTSFPGGRVAGCAACRQVEEAPEGEESRAMMAKVASGRSADISFVLDRLTGHRPAWRHSRMIDAHRTGAAGHSIGGNAAARAMADDPRVRAGVDMDGTLFAPVPRSGLDGRPFLLLGTAAGHSPGGQDTSWDRDWARLDGWKRWLTVTGAGHLTFIDLPVLGAQLGMTDPEAPLPGGRSGEITRDYVSAFFERHLRGVPRPLLDGPSPANPEVRFEQP